MSEWQPIETAPRDGTEILVWDGDIVSQASWTDGGYGDLGWHDRYSAQEDPCQFNTLSATHWMPLPEPPK